MPKAGRAEVGSAGEIGGTVPEVRSILAPVSMAFKQMLGSTGVLAEAAGGLGVAVAIPAYETLEGSGFVDCGVIIWLGC